MQNNGSVLVGGLLIMAMTILGFVLYFLPALVAQQRKSPQVTAIAILNFFLGWTVVGWVGALVWACAASPAVQTQQAGEAVLCSGCGKYSPSGADYCAKCGAKIY